MVYRVCLTLTFVCVLVSAANTSSKDDKSDALCEKCDAHGELRKPNKAFTYRENCREYLCKCDCNGDWECPPERVETFCQPSNPQCGTCWAGGAMQEGNKAFKFTEGCFQYNCFCNCDGAWNCPPSDTIDICNYNVTSACYYCDVYGVKFQGNSYFKHVDGCIEYDCTCNCDGSWNCPGERAIDTCNQNPDTGCYYCDVYGKRYEGKSHFVHVNGCIEYNCDCNCDSSWDCPGERAIDTCRTNRTTGCYYCDVYGYLYDGNSKFPLIVDCFEYQCDCMCDGGWTCKHSVGQYVCDAFGNEPISECRTCELEGNTYRGESRFYYQKGCITYKCSCDCGGRYYCPGNEAFYTCAEYETESIASLSSSYTYVYTEHTRSPRQIGGCLPCEVDGRKYDSYQTFSRQIGCNEFRCTCQCNGTPNCPPETAINRCVGVTGGGSGASTFGSEVDPEYTELGAGIDICIDCTYRGVTYKGNSPFTFESGCWKYNCNCRCNGSIDCPSERSDYICPGRKECIKCKVDNLLIDAKTDFELQRGCVYYDKCKCKCDGGWTCDDGRYTCDLCQGCSVDGRTYAGNSSFVLTRGCDRYKSCYCGCDSKWQCSGEVEDLCGACRKCKIGEDYYDGDTSFTAQVGCTRYQSCTCNCDGTYRCVRGVYTCGERGDLPVEDQCSNCVHGNRQYRPEQRFDYADNCVKYRGCQCKCGKTTCTQVEDTCGNCRSCLVDSTEYRGGTKFSKKNDCLHFKECDCFCSGQWKCYGESAVDTCNKCKKCNVDGAIHNPYTRFNLNRKCWRYHCFCGCDGTTNCPSQTAVNTCTQPDVCYTCEAGGEEYRGNSLFTYDHNGIVMSCKCNCDGSHYCIAEWLYIKTDLTISGADLGGCFYCYLDGRRFRGDTEFTMVKDDIDMNCQCFCNGGYYCYGEKKYESTACLGCRLYGSTYAGDSEFSLVYDGFKLACQCSCDGTYSCYGTEGTAVISCIRGIGCVSQTCGQCIVQGKSFNGGDVFGSTYKGRDVRCDCGCDGSYYCEGSGGIILSCVNGKCREFGCTSCEVFDLTYQGGTDFEVVHRGLKLDCRCECGGNYQCAGSSGEIIVSCIGGGSGCLTVGSCNMCLVNNKRWAGRSTFRYDFNGVDMLCTCSCDGSFYCKGLYELIEISCIGGTCTRIGCKSCNVFGLSYPGDSDFNIVHRGLKLNCKCQCTSDYTCTGSRGTTVISCIGGRNCLPATCGSCSVNNRNFAGRSTYRSQYKGIDLLCTCGCDSSAYCTGTTTSIEVTCVGGTCTRIGCRECSLFRKEYLGSSQFDIVYNGQKLACECDCDGGYICRGSKGVVVITCVNGVGAGCLTRRCDQCVLDGKRYPGFSTFDHVYQGVDMKCLCSCDGSYYCEGIRELIAVSCVGGTCTPIGCKKCKLYDKQIDGATPFQIVYGGYSLDCMCNCDGSYRCLGEGGVVVIQCKNNVNCLTPVCQGCRVNNLQYRGGDTFRDVYNGVDVTCTCGCDSSYICQGVSTKITLSCVGGRCNVVGCTGCSAFGRTYASFQTFETFYRGMRLSCDCDCNGGYVCTGSTGEVFVRCRDSYDCLGPTCNSCSFNSRVIPGLSVFKYDYQGIDMSCTCACDGSVFCIGVTEQIELWCVGGTCTPKGCRSCNILGSQIDPLAAFTVVHGGQRLECTCACDSGFRCLSSSGVVVIDCPAGQGDRCFAPTCRDCIVDGRRHKAKSVFAFQFENIDMTCTCGCDGSSYCKGIRIDIVVSCVGGTCSPRNCKSCSIFGQNYQAYKPFRIVHQGVWLDCTCACDSSFVCRSKPGDVVVTCRPGETCFPATCQNCLVDGRQIPSRSTFPYRYEGIAMTCTCGCDGTAICEGIKQEVILSCVGGVCALRGCRDCVIFGRSHKPYRPFQIIFEATKLDCTCDCDSSFVCYGKSKQEVLRCRPGETCPTSGSCRNCMVDGIRRQSRSVFAYKYGDIDMKCTCGCDGSAYCEGVTERIIVGCIGGTCSARGCRTCSIFGTAYQPYKTFSVVTEGTRLDCTCKCDSSFVCLGRSGKKVVDCQLGQVCFPSSCTTRDCIVDGRAYRPRSTFSYRYNNIDMRCTCGCDATSYCEGVSKVFFLSCIGERCFPIGCESCTLFGIDYQGDSAFSIVHAGLKMNCQCACDTSWRCEGKPGQNDITCTAGKRCLPKKCRKCRVDNRRYEGRETFQWDYKNIRMNCVCGCDGTYYCEGISVSYEISCPKKGPCTQVGGCRSCSIFGSEYHGGSRSDFVYQGYSMACTCNCDSSFKCIGTKGTVIVNCGIGQNCLIGYCGPCRAGGNTYRGGSVFDTVHKGNNMQCTCGCDGSYFCKGKDDGSELSCDAQGICTRAGCATCLSDGRRYHADEEFKKYYDNIQMNCLCSCDSSYRCQGVSVRIVILCRGSSCSLEGCRSCVVKGREHASGSEYYITENRQRKRCRCKCDGTSTCRDDRPACTQCVIDGVTYPGHSRHRVYRNGQPYICDCFCSGKSECNPEGPVCQECNIFGTRFPGNQEFDTVVQGTAMKCKCDCDGSFECTGGGRTCTSAYGCTDNCPGCVIEGKTYQGKTNFDIFHNGYGIRMNCDCECGGSYRCTGTKPIPTPCPSGDCSNTCFDCTIGGRTYRGNSAFNTVLDGIRMQCVCHCTGGYTCEGRVPGTSVCTGPACTTNGCTDCRLEGKTYPSNSEFEIQHRGITMQCSCACNGTLECRGERREKLCIGSGCDSNCQSCSYAGATIPGKSRFQTVQNGAIQQCDCDCSGRLTCNSRDPQCTGPGCQTKGCRRCIIDGVPYTGNTRFVTQKNDQQVNCTCFCDGTFSCKSSGGIEYSCLGEDCPADYCRACELDGLDYQLDDKFRLVKNDLIMNCVCECDGAYRCFSVSGYCTGPDCDEYGCSSCVIGNQKFKGNSRFDLKPGTTCECDCSGEYRCNTPSLGFECVGAECGVGSCKTCLVDNERKTGNARFQIKSYGLFMQCACNCDSSFTCRGYQIISDGTSPVDIPCTPCVINGKKYNPMTRFQAIIEGSRKVCSCNCRGQHSCRAAATECRTCVIGNNEYQSNSDFTLYRSSHSIRCVCNCNGDFVCEGSGTCPGGHCDDTYCRDCLIFGTRHKGGTRFYTGNDPQLLCECLCTGEYTCKGYRPVAKVLLAPKPDVSCASCYVANQENPGNTKFKIRRDCYVIDCFCGCDGEWECPVQRPTYVCDGSEQTGVAEKVYYSLAGTIGSANEPSQFGNTRATLVYRDETSSTIFGQGGGEDCGKCVINNQQFDGNTAFVLQDGCLRWSCLCKCNGGWNCTSVVGTACTGPLDPFEGKSCHSCKAFNNTYPPEQAFTASDECYRYSCTCNCDGSYECPPEQTVKTCTDTSSIYNPQKGTCRECVIGDYRYNKGDKFEYIYDCLRYICTCKCDGEYFCPASTAVRVCRTGSGSPGRLITSGSRTVSGTKQTFVALKPAGTGSASSSVSTQYGTGRGVGTATGSGSSATGSGYISTGTGHSATGSASGSATGSGYTATGAGGTAMSSGVYSGNTGSGSSHSVSSSYVETTETKTSQSGSGSSHSGSSHSGSSHSGSVDSSTLLKSRSCLPCTVNSEPLPGGRDFTYRQGCFEFFCECFCNGSYTCPPEKTVNFCTKDETPDKDTMDREEDDGTGCKLGSRTYKTQLFSYEENCIQFFCRCFENGSYFCDPNKSKNVC